MILKSKNNKEVLISHEKNIFIRQHYYCLYYLFGHAQEIDIENVYKVNFKVSGGINANSVFYSSNSNSSREPFTYLLSGNLNLSAFSFSMPVSYSITNQGNNLGYTVPFNFNRISLMPKYKWAKAYIGDVSMSFSPYTLNGHPFRGGGLELTPKGRFKYSMMAGRLLKGVEANESPNSIPVFQRMGYGVKIGYQQAKYKLEWIGFYAKDNINSIESSFDNKGVTPKENIVTSLNIATTLVKNLELNLEYAVSFLSEDSRASLRSDNTIHKVLAMRENTSKMKALKTNINYSIQKSKLGVSYERIDPNYRTLGAMFFSNDLENITATFSRPFYKDKINVSTNVGFQRDDLAFQKKQNTKRVVGSINVNYNMSDRINLTGNYSNFTTYTNKNLSQFDYINDPNLSPADTLNYRQLAQNATFNMAYTFGKKKNQNVNLNYNIAGQANEQGGIIRKGQASTMQNYNLTHTINFMPMKMAFNTSFNYTLNTVSTADSSSKGASFSVTKKYFNDKLNTNVGVIYNTTSGTGNATSVMGLKCMSNYIAFKKHMLSLGAVQMFKKATKRTILMSLRSTLIITIIFNHP